MKPPPVSVGRYRIERLLGEGGMASVYLGRAGDGPPVAVKVVRGDFARELKYLQRFQRECRVTRELKHPSIVRILDDGVHDGVPFYAMEYLPHPTLADRLRAYGALPEPELVALSRHVLDAVASYEGRGVVHRDIKPGNVLVRPDGRPVLMDFGLAHDSTATALTATGEVLGTPAYLPPEMLRGAAVDVRADLYQWGVTLFECRAGRLPFSASTPAQVAMQAMSGDVLSLREVAPDTSRGFAAFVAGCMEPDPDGRYPDARTALADLELVAAGRPLRRASTVRARPLPAPAPALTAETRPGRPKGLRWALLGAAAVALLALTAALVSPWFAPAPEVPEPSVAVGFRSALVTWTSAAPVRVRGELREGPGGALAAAQDSVSSGREHRMVLTPERRARAPLALTLRVLPDGEPSRPALVTLAEPDPHVDLVERTSAGLRVRVRPGCRLPEGTEAALSASDELGVFEAPAVVRASEVEGTVGGVGLAVAELGLMLHVPATGERVTLDLARPFRRWAAEQSASCAKLKTDDIVVSVLGRVVDELFQDAARREQVLDVDGSIKFNRLKVLTEEEGAAFRGRLVRLQAWYRGLDWARSLAALGRSQELLMATPLLDLGEQRRVYESAELARNLNHCFLARGWLPLLEELAPFGPRWEFAWSAAGPGSVPGERSAAATEPGSAEVRFENLGVDALFAKRGERSRDLSLVVDGAALAGARAASLWLEVPELAPKLWLTVELNGAFKFSVVTYVDAPRAGPRPGPWFRHALDLRCLKPGANQVRLKGGILPGFFKEKSGVVVRRVHLCVVPKT